VCKEEGTLTKCADDCIHDAATKANCRKCSPGNYCECIGPTSKKTVRIRNCKKHGTNVMCEVPKSLGKCSAAIINTVHTRAAWEAGAAPIRPRGSRTRTTHWRYI
jgi:hypothetical protein